MKIHADLAISCPGLKIYQASILYINTDDLIELSALNNRIIQKIHLFPPDASTKNSESPFNWENTVKHNTPFFYLPDTSSHYLNIL